MSVAIETGLSNPLRHFNRRMRWIHLLRCVGWTSLVAALAFSAAAIIDYYWLLDTIPRRCVSAAAYLMTGLTACISLGHMGRFGWSLDSAAKRIESQVPDLKHHLLAAVELGEPDSEELRGDSFQFRRVLRQRVIGVLEVVSIPALAPWRLIGGLPMFALAVLILLVAVTATSSGTLGTLYRRAMLPFADIPPLSSTHIQIIEPANLGAVVPANEPLLVVAAIDSPNTVEPRLEIRDATGELSSLPMSPTVDQVASRWSGLPIASDNDFEFRVVAGDGRTLWHPMRTAPRPRVNAYTLTVSPPEYADTEPWSWEASHGDLTAVVGSTIAIGIQTDNPHVTTKLERRDHNQELSTIHAAVKENLPCFEQVVTADFQYRIRLRSLETGFENILPAFNQVKAIDDEPPRVLIQQASMRSRFCLSREVTGWELKIEDEFDVESITPQVSINGESFVESTSPVDSAVDDGQSEPQSYRVTRQGGFIVDLQDYSLSEGDLVSVRIAVTDRKGQQAYSNEVSLRVAGSYFAEDRHPYLQGRSQFTQLLKVWSGSDDEVSSTLQHLDPSQLHAAIESTAVWLAENAPTASDALETETIWNRYVALYSRASLPPVDQDPAKAQEELNRAREELAEASGYHTAFSAAVALFEDMRMLEQQMENISTGAESAQDFWVERQLELLIDYEIDTAKQTERVLASLPERVRGEFQVRAERSSRRALDLSEKIELGENTDRLVQHVKNLRQQIRNDRRNAIMHGDVAGRPNASLEKFLNQVGLHSKEFLSVSQLSAQREGIAERLSESPNTAPLNPLREEELDLKGQVTTLLARVQLALKSEVALHEARTDFDPQRIEDLRLIAAASDAMTRLSPSELERISTESPAPHRSDHWKRIANAARQLEAGQRTLAANPIWTELLADERWSDAARILRLENPRRWDYLGILFQTGARRLREANYNQDDASAVERLRWQAPASFVSDSIGSRRWDVQRRATAADQLAQMHDEWLSTTERIKATLTLARQTLREYVQLDPAQTDASELANAGASDPQDSTQDRVDATTVTNDLSNNDADQAADNQVTASNESPAPGSEQTDPRLSALEELAKALQQAAESPEEMLRRLEAQLRTDPRMQDSLSDISERIGEQALESLAQAEQEQYELQKAIENDDAAVAAEKALLSRDLKDLAARAEDVRQYLVEQAKSAAARGAEKTAVKALDEASKRLNEATREAGQSNDQMLMRELNESARALTEAIKEVRPLIAQANQRTSEAKDNQIEDNNGQRNRTRNDMQQLMKQSKQRMERGESQRLQQWTRLDRNLNNEIRGLRQRQDRRENELRTAIQRAEEKPEQRQLRDRVRELQRENEEGRAQLASREQQQQAAKQQIEASRQRLEQTKQSATPDLNETNAAADAAEQLTRQAVSQLESLEQAAGSLADSSETREGIPDAISMDEAIANRIERSEQEASRRMSQVAESLQRAARHEQRLGNQQASQALEQVAESLQNGAQPAIESAQSQADEAAQNISNARTTDDPSVNLNSAPASRTDANPTSEALARAERNTQSARSQLSDALEGLRPSDVGRPSPSRPSGSTTSPESGSEPPASNDQSPTTEPGSPRGEGTPGSPAQNQSQSPPATTPDGSSASQPASGSTNPEGSAASSTTPAGMRPPENGSRSSSDSSAPFASPESRAQLLDDLDRLIHQNNPQDVMQASTVMSEAAASIQRQQAQQPSQSSPTPQPGSSALAAEILEASMQPADTQAFSTSPNGTVEASVQAGLLDDRSPIAGEIINEDWADLRQREAEEVDQTQKSRFPTEYRAQLEAYFRAIAEQSNR